MLEALEMILKHWCPLQTPEEFPKTAHTLSYPGVLIQWSRAGLRNAGPSRWAPAPEWLSLEGVLPLRVLEIVRL